MSSTILTQKQQQQFLSFYDNETQKRVLSSTSLKEALSKQGNGSPYFFALRYCNYGGVWSRARRRKWRFISNRSYEPVDILDLACYLYGIHADMDQFRKVVAFLLEEDYLHSNGAKAYAQSICNHNLITNVVHAIWRYDYLFHLAFVVMGILTLPTRPFAGALNGIYLMDGIFDFMGSSSLRTGIKFLLWTFVWTLDRIFTPMLTPYTPLMSYGLLFVRTILVILALRCASNKSTSDLECIHIQNYDEWRGTRVSSS